MLSGYEGMKPELAWLSCRCVPSAGTGRGLRSSRANDERPDALLKSEDDLQRCFCLLQPRAHHSDMKLPTGMRRNNQEQKKKSE